MLLFKRPLKPPRFDEKMEPHRKAVADLVQTGEALSFSEDAWQRHKKHFSDVQHGKCCFCEAYVHATSHGPVEHYRPKGSVAILIEPGKEIPGMPNVLDRRIRTITEGPLRQGYWWLAYEWTNWLFACQICNTTWKKTLFPLAGTPKPQSSGPAVDDKPLLLHPYGKAKPVDHLTFDRMGHIEGTSRKGRETIRTLGLYRGPQRQTPQNRQPDV